VAPGVPRGTPAVITMDCSGAANPSRQAMRQARSTISSKLWASSVTTAMQAPGEGEPAPVPCTGVSAMIARSAAHEPPAAGRSRTVQLTMAAAGSVLHDLARAAMMASGVVASGHCAGHQ